MSSLSKKSNQPVKSDLHLAALALAAQGFEVFPCAPGTKVPACAHGLLDATTDVDMIDLWWGIENPDYNVAINPHSGGRGVVDTEHDVDPKWLSKLRKTFTVRTPRGGLHFHYTGVLPTSASKLAPKADTRGAGKGYVLMPPSMVDGFFYTVHDDREPVPVPEWITTKLAKAKTKKSEAQANV